MQATHYIAGANYLGISGGKDSTALLLWAIEMELPGLHGIFNETHWEHPLTYAYIAELEERFLPGGRLIRTEPELGFEDLCLKKGRAPSIRARFCTEELKHKPTKKFLRGLDHEYAFFTGLRRDESAARANTPDKQWSEPYDCWVNHPIAELTVDQVFLKHKLHHLEPNPLYKMGFTRVGCMPCVLVNLHEMKMIALFTPEVVKKLSDFEQRLGRTFFPPDYIPQAHCSQMCIKTRKRIPTVDDVVRYVTDNPDQGLLFNVPLQSCNSQYNLCE